jgi:NTP pyrophosphatase (non-canonical NTP hydrolase)
MTIPGYMGMDLPVLEQAIIRWHNDRNLIEGSTNQAQLVKLMEEVGELAKALTKEHKHDHTQTADAIGDILVVLINIANRKKLDLRVCLHRAYNEIKDRKGKMVDGIFIKEEADG